MKKVLVVQYSQTGQLKDIVNSVLGPLTSDKTLKIDTLTLQPQPDYPFPWTTQRFCDVFPESVAGVPCELAPLNIEPEAGYDLIVVDAPMRLRFAERQYPVAPSQVPPRNTRYEPNAGPIGSVIDPPS